MEVHHYHMLMKLGAMLQDCNAACFWAYIKAGCVLLRFLVQDDNVFGGAQWQCAGDAVLPATPLLLPAYAVKERLVTRWREVHSEETAAVQQQAAETHEIDMGEGGKGGQLSRAGAGTSQQ